MSVLANAAGGLAGGPDPRRRGRPALALVVVLLGYLTLPMLMSGTTVALPRIGAELDASGPVLQWVVVGYFLAASCLMLVAGALGDLLGRRRVFAFGAAVYAAGALASALAPGILLLDAARTLSGVGAAGVMGTGGAILGETFTGPARTRVFAAVGSTAGVGMAIGPTLSGWLVGSLGWRATFAAFAAAGVLIWAGTALMTETRAAARPRIDVIGAVTLVSALAMTMFGVNQAAEAGWDSAWVLVPLAVGVTLLAAFTVAERRASHPVLDLTLLRDRRFTAWCLACLAVAAAPAGVLAFLPTYLQGVDGASPGAAGLTMLLLTAPVLVMPQAGAWLVNRGVPARAIVTVGLLLLAAGNAWLTTLRPGIGAPGLAGPLVAIGAGMGLVIGVNDAQAMDQVRPDRLGMTAGLLSTVRGGGATLATTLFGTALINLLQARDGAAETAARIAAGQLTGPDRALHAARLTDAWEVVSWSVAAACAMLAVVIWAMLGPRRRG
ncbi:MFS transporter [Nonomuraea sp. LPB2021202275-12-8]|uniref:MFS transporter n=1 Tax=Nonomuraea sp. LPB2021202275-12-8 TaxID=3120159 RepID=UPI00300C0646